LSIAREQGQPLSKQVQLAEIIQEHATDYLTLIDQWHYRNLKHPNTIARSICMFGHQWAPAPPSVEGAPRRKCARCGKPWQKVRPL
jgi:hypothetical protein